MNMETMTRTEVAFLEAVQELLETPMTHLLNNEPVRAFNNLAAIRKSIDNRLAEIK
jgi:hypothetical protein